METRPKRIVKRVLYPDYHGPQRNDEPTMELKEQEKESFLTEAEEAKYQFILDKMNEEQKAEWRFAMRILKQATNFRSITVKSVYLLGSFSSDMYLLGSNRHNVSLFCLPGQKRLLMSYWNNNGKNRGKPSKIGFQSGQPAASEPDFLLSAAKKAEIAGVLFLIFSSVKNS